ncbi:helix-turn-helix domain-containing protein [Arcanobacterium phocae]|uniref:helix-turn-helix domain-containing protein n=1 Tax=Arcanobacterium phocae TaxID=131112 RepID=UPI001C0E90E7|nr:helix-turn-helix domain-containing protein [Arcanobacterium phocae]
MLSTTQAEQKLFTIDQAALILGVSTKTLRTWEYAGKIKAVRLGRRVMISDTTLNTIVTEGVN